MRCSLFGKLPSKRDFIAIACPRDFLDVWEPWMQGGISASRQQLGAEWQQAFLRAPIWRFWLGAELCGTTVAGAFMPSLDGLGRYFPLTLLSCADADKAFPPPEFDPQDPWFAAAEDFLLATLDRDIPFETVTARLDHLDPPSEHNPIPLPDGIIMASKRSVAMTVRGRELHNLFASLRIADYADVYAAATFWWTVGGEDYEPIALSGRRMPDPFLFADMLTGRFALRRE